MVRAGGRPGSARLLGSHLSQDCPELLPAPPGPMLAASVLPGKGSLSHGGACAVSEKAPRLHSASSIWPHSSRLVARERWRGGEGVTHP